MAGHLPALLLQDAVHAVALHGRDGVVLDDLWPMLTRLAPADCTATRAFVWRHLRQHRELGLSLDGRTAAQVGALELDEAGGVRLTASNALRMFLYGPRENDAALSGGGLALTADHERVMDEVAKGGSDGVLQNALTRSVGVPANKLAYTLYQLEATDVLERETAWIEQATSSGGFNRQTTPMLKTNLVKCAGLRSDACVGAPLTDYAGHEAVRDSSLMSNLVRTLEQSPHAILSIFQLRRALNLGDRNQRSLWHRLKE